MRERIKLTDGIRAIVRGDDVWLSSVASYDLNVLMFEEGGKLHIRVWHPLASEDDNVDEDAMLMIAVGDSEIEVIRNTLEKTR